MENYSPELSETDETLTAAIPAKTHKLERLGFRYAAQRLSTQKLVYPVAVVASVSLWFFAIRAPLWLDETVSYWQISGGVGQIWARRGLMLPGYAYVLWLTKALLGNNETVLRLPSIVAMLVASYLLYRIARKLFDQDVALVATIIFCLHPIVASAAMDARPYAFAVLLVNSAALLLLIWSDTKATRHCILFAITAAGILYFHVMFAVILAAFAIYLVGSNFRDLKSVAQQLIIGAVSLALALLPTVPGLRGMFRTANTHVFAAAPSIWQVILILLPQSILLVFGALATTAERKKRVADQKIYSTKLFCISLSLIPIGILYGISVTTPIHIFLKRYLLVAVPGISLLWGLIVSRIESRKMRQFICVALVLVTVYQSVRSPGSKAHGYTWKYALEFASRSAATDNAPLLICSDLPESNYEPMPDRASASPLFAPLSYYKVNARVVPLPRALNAEAVSDLNRFLAIAAPARSRFILLAYFPSSETIDWLKVNTKGSYMSHDLGVFDGVAVVEFVPRITSTTS